MVLNSNKISNLAPLGRLQTRGLKIKNISLDSNAITNFEELSALSGLELQELVLSNNPVCADLDDVTYKL